MHPWAHGWEKPGKTAPRDVPVYMTVFNRGASADKLIGVSSPLAESGELRVVTQTVTSIPFGPAAGVQLAFDGPNIVLHGVTDDFAGYEAFPVWLVFEKVGRVEASVMVEVTPSIARDSLYWYVTRTNSAACVTNVESDWPVTA